MLKPIACELLARLKMAPLDPATGNDSGASTTMFTYHKGKALMISRLLPDSEEDNSIPLRGYIRKNSICLRLAVPFIISEGMVEDDHLTA